MCGRGFEPLQVHAKCTTTFYMKRIVKEIMSDGTERYVVEKRKRFLWLTWYQIDTMIAYDGVSIKIKQCIYDNLEEAEKRIGMPINKVVRRDVIITI